MKPGEVVGRTVRVPASRSPFVRLDVQGGEPIGVCRLCMAAAPLALLVGDVRAFVHADGCEVGQAVAQSRKPVEVVDVGGLGH